MSRVYFISDLHFNHKNVMNFAGDYRQGDTYIDNMHITIDLWNAKIKKNDTVYVLGDVAWDREGLEFCKELRGNKLLVRGNHDTFMTKEYLEVFGEVYGIRMYKGYWLSHAPVHPCELRGRKNIHGHVHQNTVLTAYSEVDERYINVCIEATGGAPVLFEDIREGNYGTKVCSKIR